MAARIDNGLVQLLTRTGLDWTAKYPSASRGACQHQRERPPISTASSAASTTQDCRASLTPKRRPTASAAFMSSITLSISCISAEWDVSSLPLIERKELLEPLVTNKPGLQFKGPTQATANSS